MRLSNPTRRAARAAVAVGLGAVVALSAASSAACRRRVRPARRPRLFDQQRSRRQLPVGVRPRRRRLAGRGPAHPDRWHRHRQRSRVARSGRRRRSRPHRPRRQPRLGPAVAVRRARRRAGPRRHRVERWRPADLGGVDGRDVYVLNAGAGNNISGFRIGRDGLDPVPGSTQPLSQPDAGGAQVAFTPDGRHLVVTERFTNRIDTFHLRRGVAEPAVVSPSTGPVPFRIRLRPAGRADRLQRQRRRRRRQLGLQLPRAARRRGRPDRRTGGDDREARRAGWSSTAATPTPPTPGAAR